jgi:hypothetical protein
MLVVTCVHVVTGMHVVMLMGAVACVLIVMPGVVVLHQ